MLKDSAIPGDILLYRINPAAPWHDRLIAAGEILLREDSSSSIYYHTGLVAGLTQYEAVVPRLTESIIDWDTPGLELWRVKDASPLEVSAALRWAKVHLGCWYDIGPYIFGLYSFKNTYTCSEYVRGAYLHANIDLAKTRQKLFTPNDLVTDKLIRIG